MSATTELAMSDKGRVGAHRLGHSCDEDSKWRCWDCHAAADTRIGLESSDDCPGNDTWCSMCRTTRRDHECICSLSGLGFERCGFCGQWELEPERAPDGQPICRSCDRSEVDVAQTLRLMTGEAALLPIAQHEEQYSVLARRITQMIPVGEDPGPTVLEYAAAFESVAEALGSLRHLAERTPAGLADTTRQELNHAGSP